MFGKAVLYLCAAWLVSSSLALPITGNDEDSEFTKFLDLLLPPITTDQQLGQRTKETQCITTLKRELEDQVKLDKSEIEKLPKTARYNRGHNQDDNHLLLLKDKVDMETLMIAALVLPNQQVRTVTKDQQAGLDIMDKKIEKKMEEKNKVAMGILIHQAFEFSPKFGWFGNMLKHQPGEEAVRRILAEQRKMEDLRKIDSFLNLKPLDIFAKEPVPTKDQQALSDAVEKNPTFKKQFLQRMEDRLDVMKTPSPICMDFLFKKNKRLREEFETKLRLAMSLKNSKCLKLVVYNIYVYDDQIPIGAMLSEADTDRILAIFNVYIEQQDPDKHSNC